jgi:hypothetical protein
MLAEEEPGRRLLTKDEARRSAANISPRLPELLRNA